MDSLKVVPDALVQAGQLLSHQSNLITELAAQADGRLSNVDVPAAGSYATAEAVAAVGLRASNALLALAESLNALGATVTESGGTYGSNDAAISTQLGGVS